MRGRGARVRRVDLHDVVLAALAAERRADRVGDVLRSAGLPFAAAAAARRGRDLVDAALDIFGLLGAALGLLGGRTARLVDELVEIADDVPDAIAPAGEDVQEITELRLGDVARTDDALDVEATVELVEATGQEVGVDAVDDQVLAERSVRTGGMSAHSSRSDRMSSWARRTS